MPLNPLHRKPAEDMTLRARWYLTIGGLRHFLIGGFALAYPQMFVSPVYVPLLAYAPLPFWAVTFLIAGLFCQVACWNRSPSYARVGLILSATSTAAWGVALLLGIISAWEDGVRITPILAILLLTLAAKDYAVCTQPLRSPFEQLLCDRVRKLSRSHSPPGRGERRAAPSDLLHAALELRHQH